MARITATLALIILILGMMLGLAVVFRTGAKFSKGIHSESEKWEMSRITENTGTFSFTKLKYDTDKSMPDCGEEYDLVVEISMVTATKPDKCSAYLDGTFKKEKMTEEACSAGCGEEITMAFNMGKADLYFPHTVEICCDDNCIKKEIEAKC